MTIEFKKKKTEKQAFSKKIEAADYEALEREEKRRVGTYFGVDLLKEDKKIDYKLQKKYDENQRKEFNIATDELKNFFDTHPDAWDEN